MKRAGVFIGVNKTGNATKLNDAAAGAERMGDWASRQGMENVVITDANKKRVEVRDITKAIADMVAKKPQQLVVYFAGHGINIGRSERWLLSDAPTDANAAVNLNGSAEAASQGSVEHVVFISDACRTAADGLQAQSVSGSIVLPNQGGSGTERAVDLFWATIVGDPAHEIKLPGEAAAGYKALYTGALLDALEGKIEGVVESDPPDTVVRPWPLKRFLLDDMQRRITDAGLALRVIQKSDARITSDPEKAWLSRLAKAGGAGGMPPTGGGGGPPPGGPRPQGPRDFITISDRGPLADLESLSDSLMNSALYGVPLFDANLAQIRTAGAGIFGTIAEDVDHTRKPAGTDHFETECGFKIRGARVVQAFCRQGVPQVLGNDLVRMQNAVQPGASVLIILDNGNGAVIPAIPGFIGALTVKENDLVDVAYEPSSQTWRWNEFKARADKIRALRAVAASATKSGVFRLSSEGALRLAKEMQYAKGLDPSLAVYAAYAYADIRRREHIRQMSGYMRGDLGFRLFDIAMLARELDDKALTADPAVLPFFPMLSQGWALLGAYRLKLPPWFETLEQTLQPSVWSLFNPKGVDLVRRAILSGEVR